MKQFLKVTGYVLLCTGLLIYLAFLIVLPRITDLNKYKPELQKLVKDNTNLTLDFKNARLITTPFLETGVKADNITIELPDGSNLFKAESLRGKVFLPSLLGLTVRVSGADVNSPELNLEISDSEKLKISKVFEDLVNQKRKEQLTPKPTLTEKEEHTLIDPSKIKIIVPALKLNNYKAQVNDTKTGHSLTLKGDQLKLGYFNGKFAKIKTDAQLLSDNNTNITANIDINTFLPQFEPKEEDIDNEAVFALPFINPVEVYQNYNLKSNIDAKLKVRQDKTDNKIWTKGFLNIDNTTLTLSGTELPESYFKLKAKGYRTNIDTNLYVTNNEYLHVLGGINYGKHPSVDISVNSPAVHFNNLLNITRAYFDSIHVRNDIANMSADGYFLSNFKLKTNFKDIRSNGKFVIRNGNISHKNIGLVFNNINANLLFDDNTFNVRDTHMLINDRTLEVSGKIDPASNTTNINISADKIPLKGLYSAFMPKEIKNAYDLKSGNLTIDTKITGEIKETATLLKLKLEDFILSDRTGNFTLENKSSRLGFANSRGVIRGRFKNEDFKLNLPKLNSTITDETVIADINKKDINFKDSEILFNQKSSIVFNGEIKDYLYNPHTRINVSGGLADSDLKTLIGNQISPYLDSTGEIPVKAKFDSKGDKTDLTIQIKATPLSYISPVLIYDFAGKQALFQLKAHKEGDEIKIKKSGLYLRKHDAPFNDRLSINLLNAREVISVRAIISNLSTKPFINLLKVRIPKDLEGSICKLQNSGFTFGGGLFAFGKVTSPSIKGNFYIRNLTMPELYTNIRDIDINLSSKDLKAGIKDVNANGSDFNIDIITSWKNLSESKISNVKVNSRLINLDKLTQITEALTEILPPQTESVTKAAADIPVEILDGTINLNRIKTGDITVRNTTSKISLAKNTLYLNNLKTHPIGGYVDGKAAVNLITYELMAKVHGRDFDIEKVLLDTMQMKDMLSGNMRFIADIKLKGLTLEEQLKTLKGYVDFDIKDGQLGPFGKFENFLMAENLRENAFFSSTIGSIIKNIVTIDTSHFNNMFGHLTFNDGFAELSPIKTQGDVMSMYIAGKIGLIDNSADMKTRGKLASTFSDSLGPLANINPVNLVKNTPGLNIVAAKTFSIFCEQISQEELEALPSLAENKSDDYATKFQIILRGDTRKPLKMIKSFKWLALDSEIESAQNFVDTIPIPQAGEENLSVEEIIKIRNLQTTQPKPTEVVEKKQSKSLFKKIFKK